MAGSALARLLPPLSSRTVSPPGRGLETAGPSARRALGGALEAFAGGFNLARRIADDPSLARALRESFDSHHVGFAFEGAGGQRALIDLVLPWRRGCLGEFAAGAAGDHDYITAVGAGLILARVPGGAALVPRFMRRLDPLLAWCVPDGFGFASALARPDIWVDRRKPPPSSFEPFAGRLFDAGLGRSLWWLERASPPAIRELIDRFSGSRRPYLWFGTGLASAYAGGANQEQLESLRREAGAFAPHLLAGVPFACRLRQKGGNPSPATDLASKVLLEVSANQAATVLKNLLAETLSALARPEQMRTETFDQLHVRLVERIRSGNSPFAPPGALTLTRAV